MTGPRLKFLGRTTMLTALSFRAELDAGWSGEAVLSEPVAGIRHGAQGQLILGDRPFDVIVEQFHTPWRSGQGPWVSFCDPVSFEPPFVQGVFASAAENLSFAQVIASRLAILPPDEFLQRQFPHVLVDGLSLVETLRAMIARLKPSWHWRWLQEKIEIGPLPEPAALELETSNEADIEGGFEADLHLDVPQLGDRVKAAGPGGAVREGNVTQIRIHLPDRPLVCRIRVAETPLSSPVPSPAAGSLLHEGTVDRLDPLMVRVHLPIGDTPPARGRLYTLRTEACRVGVPLQAGDHVLVEWPLHALTTEPLRVFAEAESSPSPSLEIVAKAIRMQGREIRVLSREVNIDELPE